MQKKFFKSFGKLLSLGALALAISVPVSAGTANAATSTPTVQYQVYYYGTSGNMDWQALLQQYWPQYFYRTLPVQQPVQQKPVTTQPVQQKPVQQKPVTTKPAAPTNTGSTTTASSFASQVVNLVNQERAKAGLSPLKSNSALANMALVKAKDMKNNNYFDHNSPTYGSPFDMMKQFGISYRYAGENIAMGQRTPQEVMTAWMNSSGHRANILNANYTQIGVAYYNGEWVQEFIG